MCSFLHLFKTPALASDRPLFQTPRGDLAVANHGHGATNKVVDFESYPLLYLRCSFTTVKEFTVNRCPNS